MQDLTGFQRDLLTVIGGLEKPKGLAIKAELDEYYASEINHGRLYPNLDKLVDLDLIEKGKKDDRTNLYSLTDKGKEVLADRREWEIPYTEDID